MKEIIDRVLDGDKEAFREIVREYTPLIRVYLSSRLADFQSVEDLSQEVFLAVYYNLDRYDGKADFAVWVRAICRNKLMSYFRSHYSRENRLVKFKELVISQLDSVRPKDMKVLTDRLDDCFEKLSDKAAEVIKKKYLENKTAEEIADEQATSKDSVTSLLFRSRKQLKICMKYGDL